MLIIGRSRLTHGEFTSLEERGAGLGGDGALGSDTTRAGKGQSSYIWSYYQLLKGKNNAKNGGKINYLPKSRNAASHESRALAWFFRIERC